jgi:hypothetical protein
VHEHLRTSCACIGMNLYVSFWVYVHHIVLGLCICSMGNLCVLLMKYPGRNMDTEDTIMCLMLIYWYLKTRQPSRIPRIRDNNSSLSGCAYTLELLNGSDVQCHELMRMSREAYIHICSHFRRRGWLQDSLHISVEEKMAMFLGLISHNQRLRVVKRRFQHSSQTVHVYIHEVLNAMMEFAREMIVPTPTNMDSNDSGDHMRLRSVFKV